MDKKVIGYPYQQEPAAFLFGMDVSNLIIQQDVSAFFNSLKNLEIGELSWWDDTVVSGRCC